MINPTDNTKYSKMGVNPEELYMRQNGLCWLVFIKSNIDSKEVIEDLCCTDGKEYAPTKYMLNPTFECVQCLSKFVLEKEYDMTEKLSKVKDTMSILMSILVHVHSFKKRQEAVSISMDLDTFINVENFLNDNIMCSNETAPIKNNGTSKSLFGVLVYINNKIKTNTIIVNPGDKHYIIK